MIGMDWLGSFTLYRYSRFEVPLVTRGMLMELLGWNGPRKTSLDLGRTWGYVYVEDSHLVLDGYRYNVEELLQEVGEGDIYILGGGRYGRLAYYRDGLYYRLYAPMPYTAPTIEISGIKMHRVVGITPWRDAYSKVSLLRLRRGDKVLDTCTGLGYTAIHSLHRGAEVVTVEVDRNVLDMAKYNPWSDDLVDIPIILGDVAEVVGELPRESFDAVIHDPPRFSRAGELYSLDFYKSLARVLRRGGRLVHYVGQPRYKSGVDMAGGVMKRLRRAGFRPTRIWEHGVIYAVKI